MNAPNNESTKSESKQIPTTVEISKSSVIQVETKNITKHEPFYLSSEWWLVGITLALAFFTAKLWKATKTMVDTADATAQRQLRAYVGVLNSEIINLGTSKPIKTHVTIKNFGKTPAYAMTGFSGVGFAESFDALNTTTIPTNKSFGVLNPNGDFIITPMCQPCLRLNTPIYLMG